MQLIASGRRSTIAPVCAEFLRAFANNGGKGNVERAFAEDAVARLFVKTATGPIGVPGDGSGAIIAESVLGYVRSLPGSITAALARRVLGVDVSGGPVVVPGRDRTKTGGGNAKWIKAGDPVPVVRLDIAGTKLEAYKCASITILSVELAKNPAARPIIENLQAADIVDVVDTSLLDGQAGDDSRPPSLLYGAIGVPSSADMLTDLQALFAAVPLAVSPLLLISRADYLLAASLNLAANGKVADVDCIVSDAMPDSAQIVYLDAADTYVTAGSDFDVSQTTEAAVHMESDPLPLIAQDDVPAAVPSSPVISLYQQSLVGARIVLPIGWAAAPGRVAYLQPVTP